MLHVLPDGEIRPSQGTRGSDSAGLFNGRVSDLTGEDVLIGLLHHWSLSDLVPRVLAFVERDSLASGGWFRGDYVRALMEIPGAFWTRHPTLYDRYRAALRASAASRRHLTLSEQAEFWTDLDPFFDE